MQRYGNVVNSANRVVETVSELAQRMGKQYRLGLVLTPASAGIIVNAIQEP